jgi:hypothetical protein
VFDPDRYEQNRKRTYYGWNYRADSRTKPDGFGHPTVCVTCGEHLPKPAHYRRVPMQRMYCDWHRNPSHRPLICRLTHEINDSCPKAHES